MRGTNILWTACILTTSVIGCKKESIKQKAGDYTFEAHAQHDLFKKTLERYQTATQAPGTILLVAKPGTETWIGALGAKDIGKNTAMLTNTPVRVGSITKMYIATYILMLCQQGLLSLDTKLQEVLPGIAAEIPGSGPVTVKQLLSHLSGVYDPSNNSNRYKTDLINDPKQFATISIPELLEKYVFGKQLSFSPGNSYSYSNSGYWLLGLIAEKVKGGKKLGLLLREELLIPNNLKHTFLETADPGTLSKGYAVVSGKTLQDVTLLDAADGDSKAHGGIVATAEDIGSFVSLLFTGELLTASNLNLMKEIQLSDCNSEECAYGLGLEIWDVQGLQAFGHNGSSVGYEANVLFFEKNKTVVFLYKNIGGGSDKRFLYDLVN